MKRTALSLLLVFSLTTLYCYPSTGEASANFVLKGRIIDVDGKPVEGGEIFVYDNTQTRRPADFISPITGRDGLYRIEIPAGRYWVVARVRSGARYGPLMSGGRHSGEAREIEAAAGQELALDFTVADVREMARNLRKSNDDYRSVGGRILDKNGRPVRGAYAFVRREKDGARLPDFISAWSAEDGRYTLHLPSGRYHLGASTAYPPEDGTVYMELNLDSVKIDSTYDIRIKFTDSTMEEGNQNSKEND
jgi:hypothetical protein